MNQRYTNIPLIDLSLYPQRKKEFHNLYSEKAKILNDWIQNQKEHSDEYFEKAIQWWKIHALINNIKWDNIIEDILNQKFNFLQKKLNVPEHKIVDLLIDKAVIRFQLEQKKITPNLPFDNKHYVHLLLRFVNEVPKKLNNETDPINSINIEILAFSYQNQINMIKAPTIKISKADAEKVHKKMLDDYNHYIDLLIRKRNLIQTKLDTFYYCNPIEKIDDELLFFNLKWEIEAKKNYANNYFKDRNF